MIQFHLAPDGAGNPCVFAGLGLRILDGLFGRSDRMKRLRGELELDIVIAGITDLGRDRAKEELPQRFRAAYQSAKSRLRRLPARREAWIVFCGHHSAVLPGLGVDTGFAQLGPDAVGVLALMEGGATFVTRTGARIENDEWEAADEYVVSLISPSRG